MITKKTGSLLAAFIFSLFLSLNLTAQENTYTVTGKVTDDRGVPLEYATISLQSVDDPSILTGGITDRNGIFSIDVQEGVYDIKVEFISFEPKNFPGREITSDLEMGTIELGIAAANLDEVVVTAETTQVEIRLDKKIYTIGQDLTTAGGSVADALNNVPSVAVDIDGGISLRGNENVRILINGKPSAMAGFGDTGVLAQLPADAIERVEVITSPSARYTAEGTAGILNIILKQQEILGFNGSVTASVGTPAEAGISANLNYRTEDYNVFTNLGYRYFDAPRNSFSDTEYLEYFNDEGVLVEPLYERVIEDRRTTRLNSGYHGSLGLEYFIDDQSSITGSTFFRTGEDEDVTTNLSTRFIDGEAVQETKRVETQTEEDMSYQFALNYINRFNDSGHQLTADLQYEHDEETQESFIVEEIVIGEPEIFPFEEIITDETQQEYLVQADYVLPIGEDTQFEAGYRGNFEEEVTDYNLYIDQVLDENLSNMFTYNENVNSLYTQYGTKLGKFSFLAGLRLENTQLKGKIDSELTEEELQEVFLIPIDTDFNNNYLGLFPTLNLIYELQENENITLGYNRRINRPRGWFINPFPSRSSRTDIFVGNPNLEPAFSNAFDLGYLKRWEELTLTSSVYYQHETDAFERVEQATGLFTTDSIPITRTIPINLATNERLGAEAGLLYNPADWLRLNGSFNFFQFDTQGEYGGEDYSAKNTSWFARFSSKVTLPAQIDWQTTAYYRGASEDAQTTRDAMASINMALSKELWNETATITLNVSDLLNSRKREAFTRTEFFERYSENQWRSRSVSLSFTYRFNQQKREQQRRLRNAGNDNEQGEMIEGGDNGGDF